MKKNETINIEWPTQHQDLKAAHEIMQKHVDMNGGEPLKWADLIYHPSRRQKVTSASAWINDIIQHFMKKYGFEQGCSIAEKVLVRCIVSDETVH